MRVVAVGRIDDDAVGLAVARCAAERAGEVDVHAGHVGSGQVVHGDEVGAAEGVEVDPLDTARVHGDGGLSAEEAKAVSVGRQIDLLRTACAVEEHRVSAVLALDDIAAVAGIPDEGVVTGAHECHVVAAVSIDGVVSVAAEQQLGARASGQAVVSGSAVDRQRDVTDSPVALVDADEIVALLGIEIDSPDAVARDGEVRVAVVTDVELEHAGVPGLQAQREPVAPLAALDRQHAVLELRALDLSRRGVGLNGRDPRSAREGGDDQGHEPQPPGLRGVRALDSNDRLHGCSFPTS